MTEVVIDDESFYPGLMQRTDKFQIEEGPVPGFVVPMERYTFWSAKTKVEYVIKEGRKALFLLLGDVDKRTKGDPAAMLRHLGWVPFREKEELEEQVRLLERELRILRSEKTA